MDVVLTVRIRVSPLSTARLPATLRPLIPAAVEEGVARALRDGEQHGFVHALEDEIGLSVESVALARP